MARQRVLVGTICLMLGVVGATRAAADSEPVQLKTVLVSPRRIPGLFVNASEFPGNATVFTAEEISASGATSLPELLGRAEGVTIMDTNGFGLGADGSVNLRGVVNSSRTNALVLLNGVRQNRVTGDEVHWQAIPMAQIERIEIIRGGGGLIYGEGAFAGVINLITKKGGERPLEFESTTEVGRFGQRTYSVASRGAAGPLTYGTSYQRRDIGGYRESTNSRTTTVTSHVGVDVLPSLHLETHVLHSEDTSYFPGGITLEQSQTRRRQRGSFFGFFDDMTTQVSLDSRWTGPHGLTSVTNAFWRLRESDSDTGSRLATIAPSQGLSLRGGHDHLLGAAQHTLVAGIDLLDEKASVGTRGSTFSESNKHSYGLFVEETLRLWDRVSLVTGLRFDKARFEEDISFPAFVGTLRFEGWSPKVGVSVDVSDPLTVYANYARPFKAPNVDDFSATVPSGFIGNLSLQPQQADDYEVGLRLEDPRLGTTEASWFYSRVHDEILFNDLPGNDQNQNFDTRRTGVEVSLEPMLPFEHLTGSVTYTFVNATFAKGALQGNRLPGTPKNRVTASLAYEPVPGLIGSLDWVWVRNFFRINDFNNSLPGDDYGVLNLGLRFVFDNFTVYFKVENAANQEYTTFQSSNGVATVTGENPAPPTSWLGGITIKF